MKINKQGNYLSKQMKRYDDGRFAYYVGLFEYVEGGEDKQLDVVFIGTGTECDEFISDNSDNCDELVTGAIPCDFDEEGFEEV